MKRGPKKIAGKADPFFKMHFFRIVANTMVAVLLISWVNYKSELINNVDEIGIPKTTSAILSQEECDMSCDPMLQKKGVADTKLKHCKLLTGSVLIDAHKIGVWGDTMSHGSVWYTGDIR